MQAALRIAWDALAFRIRRREANNILTSLSLAVAFQLPWLDIGYRALIAVLLNAYVYLMNDYFDIDLDLASPEKDQTKARFMAEHRGAAIAALVGLGLMILLAALLHSALLTVVFVGNTVVALIYSGWLKRWPLVDLGATAFWGGIMALLGMPVDALPASIRSLLPAGFGHAAAAGIDSAVGWKLAGLLALLCSSFEVIQVVRDEPADRAAGIMTTGVLLGAPAAGWVFRVLVTVAALYSGLTLRSPVPAALLIAVILPLTPERAERTWDLSRIVFGAVWVTLLALLYFGRLG